MYQYNNQNDPTNLSFRESNFIHSKTAEKIIYIFYSTKEDFLRSIFRFFLPKLWKNSNSNREQQKQQQHN